MSPFSARLRSPGAALRRAPLLRQRRAGSTPGAICVLIAVLRAEHPNERSPGSDLRARGHPEAPWDFPREDLGVYLERVFARDLGDELALSGTSEQPLQK